MLLHQIRNIALISLITVSVATLAHAGRPGEDDGATSSSAKATPLKKTTKPAAETFKGNWTKSYTLINGDTITHTPEHVSIGGLTFMSSFTSTVGSRLNSLKIPGPKDLVVSPNMSTGEFETALIQSGVLKKPAAKK